MQCTACQFENPAGMAYCGQCGTPLRDAVPCRTCGRANPPGARYCAECGSAVLVNDGVPQATRPPAPPPRPRTLTRPLQAPPLVTNGTHDAPLSPTPRAARPPQHTPQPDRDTSLMERPAGVFAGVAPLTPFDTPLVPMMDERKLVTIVFGDISGFVQLAEKLDPEEVKQVMDRSLRRLSEEVTRYEGRVDKFLGDNIMAIFGAPRAHEDDAERAVRCAIEMQAAMRELSSEFERTRGFRLALHIGINTGEVLAGRMGSGRDQDYTVMGDAVNLAARLQHTAAEGEILVGEATYRATREVIEYRERGTVQVRGKSEPVLTWDVVRVQARRGSGRGISGLEARMVGRDDEFTTLKGLYNRMAQERQQQQVVVLGAAGLGKSRLLWEFEKYLDGLPQTLLFRKGRCLPYGPGVGFRALGEILKAQCAILDDDPRPVAEAKLHDAVQEVFSSLVSTSGSLRDLVERAGGGHAQALAEATGTADVGTIVHWLGVVLGLRRADDGTAIDPDTVRDELFWAVRRFFARLAASQPLVLAFEDIHWADSSLLDFIEHLRETLAQLPILVLCQARPELAESGSGAAWVSRARLDPHCAVLPLYPLTDGESRALIRALLHNANLPPTFEALVLSKAEGNPLYVEEIMRILIDSGTLVRRAEVWEVVKPLEGARIPDTIQALVAARLDGLPELEKRVIQGASVVGRIFWRGAVDEMFPQLTLAQVHDALDMLEGREFIVERAGPTFTGEGEYSFRNVLTRDVAYNSLPKALRGDAHAHVGAWIVGKAGDRVREFAELLAYHYEQALLLGREMQTLRPDTTLVLEDHAIQFLELAGDVAGERQALTEAEQYYWRALEIIGASTRFAPEGTTPSPLYDRYLSVLCSHAVTVMGQENYVRALAELNTVIEQAGRNRTARARALLQRAEVHRHQGNLPALEEDATAALTVFRNLNNHRGTAEARLLLGAMQRQRDNLDAAKRMLDRALVLFRRGREGLAPGVRPPAADLRGEAQVMRELGLAALSLDDLRGADRYLTAALDAFRRLGDRREAAGCLRNLALLHWYDLDLRQFEEYIHAAHALVRELGHKHGEALVLGNMAFVHGDRRRLDRAEADGQHALALLMELGERRSTVWVLRTLGMVTHLRGQNTAAHDYYDQALVLAQATGIRGVLPELYRGMAETALAEGDVPAALDHAETATRLVATEDSFSLGTSWRIRGLAQAEAGQYRDGVRSLEHSIASLPVALYPLEHARSQAALAHTLTRLGELERAATHHDMAYSLLGRLVWADSPPSAALLLRLADGTAGPVPA